MTVTCPATSPSAAAARASYTSSTRWTSRKWFPEPSVPTWLRPRSSAVSDTASGSASRRQPPSSVAPVDVRHGERAADDPGQVGHVRELRERRIVPQLRHELLARVDPAGHAHAALARDLPDPLADPLQLHGQTSRMMRAHHPPAVSRSASWW